jgi:hypothetical protein
MGGMGVVPAAQSGSVRRAKTKPSATTALSGNPMARQGRGYEWQEASRTSFHYSRKNIVFGLWDFVFQPLRPRHASADPTPSSSRTGELAHATVSFSARFHSPDIPGIH